MEAYLAYIFIAFVIVMLIGTTLYSNHQKEQRTLALQSVASTLGLKFDTRRNGIPAVVRGMLPGSGEKKFRNHLSGRRDNYTFHLFDYSCAESKHNIIQTVIALDLLGSGLHLPKFILRSRRMSDNIKKGWLGYDYIDLPTKYKDEVLIGFEDNLDLQEMVDTVPAALWRTLPSKSYWLCDGKWFVCYVKGEQIEATSGELEQAIFDVLDKCYKLNHSRIKASKIK